MAATVFTGGCNLRCPFCHNASLVLRDRVRESAVIEESEFFAFLEKRRRMLEGVCVSGGEPTLMPDILPFLSKIKELGYSVKLDTNGSRPDVLRAAIEQELVDYVAMDIKNSKEKYAMTVGLDGFDISPVCESIKILLKGKVGFEFRTTVVPSFHTEDDIKKICEWIRGAENYFIQPFKNSGDILGGLTDTFSDAELEKLLAAATPLIPNTKIRG
jgi:pyruvate formate lyase activating enzyme